MPNQQDPNKPNQPNNQSQNQQTNNGQQSSGNNPPRRRGRPPKAPNAGQGGGNPTNQSRPQSKPNHPNNGHQNGNQASGNQANSNQANGNNPPRRRGRPPKASQNGQQNNQPSNSSNGQPSGKPSNQNQPSAKQPRVPQPGKRGDVRIVQPAPGQGVPSVSATFSRVGKNKKAIVSQATEHPSKSTLRIIPLGGMCEIGKNMTAYEYGSDIIIVDCGQSFPDESMPGVDAVIPDFTYILQNRDRVRGIFLTHGHEDHIGALPWLLKELPVPVYGGRMTIELVRYKLEDRVAGLSKSVSLQTVLDGQTIRCGCFGVEFIHVNHSIADAFMFCIQTPVGKVIHSGDFKIDYTPIHGGIMDLQRIAELGREGVLLFVCESTNIEVRGHSKSERQVGESFAQMFAGAPGRIFVATFSSNVFRLQQIFTAAEALGRKVALVGRSMLNVFNAANSLGYIQMKPETLIDINQIDNYAPEKVVIISTGSQGEPMSALTRIAFSSHREVEILPGDTVIISASPIPGNEKPVYKVINELYKRGAKVYYSALADVHASGHASRDELTLVQSLIKPRYFIPAHGEYRMLYQQCELGHSLGIPWENMFILNNGDIFEIAHGKARIAGFTNGATVLIDGSSVGEVDNMVLRERKILSDDGVVAVSVVLNRRNGDLAAPPVVHAMGFLYETEYEQMMDECAKRATAYVQRCKQHHQNAADGIKSGQMRDQLRTFLFEKTKRRPVVMVALSEV